MVTLPGSEINQLLIKWERMILINGFNVYYVPVVLAENTFGAVGRSIIATYWIILLGAAGLGVILLTVRLDTNTGIYRITD